MIERLNGAVGRVHGRHGGVVGAGFLVDEQRLLTCAHVVTAALGLPARTLEAPPHEVPVSFPLIDAGDPLPARVARWDLELDVAGLQLDAPPVGASPVQLMDAASLWAHPFGACGFPSGYAQGVWTHGTLRGRTGEGWIQLEGLVDPGYWVKPGFSGTAIWDENLDGVVGMAVGVEMNRAVKAAYMIPAKALVAAWPDLTTDAACEATSGLNPFYDRGRINDPGRLFDRDRMMREMRQMLKAGNSVSLVGERQIGKSSVLCALQKTARTWLPGTRVHYVDLQEILDEEDFCVEVLEGMGREPGGLRALKRALRRESLVLLLDEVEKLNRPEFTQNIHDLLRGLAQRPTLTLAVASARPLIEVFPPEAPTSPLHNIFTKKRLGPFAVEDARRFLRERLRDTGVVFAAAEVEWLVGESGGHPAQLQRLACRLFDAKRGG